MTRHRRLWNDRRGTIALEFAFVFPILLLLTVGCLELALMMLLDASVELGLVEASRTGSLSALGTESQRKAKIEEIVSMWVSRWVPGSSTLKIETFVYPALNNANAPTWVDSNNNGQWDPGEGTSPANGGIKLVPGIGLQNSLVLYDLTVTRPGFTGILRLVGVDQLEFRRQALVLNE
ncbi:MAG TPA: TadE/TadG family type IV pilus assembly protein [Magnetospirillum sp.]|nr:TadE/TadG family type IV pilus assembly protein [Magnetospirillum sp.]